MINRGPVRDYLERCGHRLAAIHVLCDRAAWADVVRESQEVVELALNALFCATSTLTGGCGDLMANPSKAVRYTDCTPASARASRAAEGASRKRDTRCELTLRRAVHRLGLRYRVDVATLPGRPDLVFSKARVVIFCDGDFWHGRDLTQRLAKLRSGHNAPYWVAKISGNVARDQRTTQVLEADGWLVLRFWETDIRRDPEAIAAVIADAVRRRRGRPGG